MTNAELKKVAEICEQMKPYQAMVDEAQAEVDKLKAQLKEMIGDCEDEIFAGDFKVSFKTVITERINSAKLKKELPEIAAAYSVAQPSRRLLVK